MRRGPKSGVRDGGEEEVWSLSVYKRKGGLSATSAKDGLFDRLLSDWPRARNGIG